MTDTKVATHRFPVGAEVIIFCGSGGPGIVKKHVSTRYYGDMVIYDVEQRLHNGKVHINRCSEGLLVLRSEFEAKYGSWQQFRKEEAEAAQQYRRIQHYLKEGYMLGEGAGV